MNSKSQSKLKPYVFKWKDFGNHLKRFITKELKSLEADDFDIVISFRRGGSILGQSFVCMIQDKSKHYHHLPCVRDIPSEVLCKEHISTFLNRLVASPAEFSDLIKLEDDLEKEIKKKLENKEKKKLNILLIDDNIITGLRLKFFSNWIEKKFGDRVTVKKLIFYSRDQKLKNEVDYIIFDNPEFKSDEKNIVWYRKFIRHLYQVFLPKFEPDVVNMPWHSRRILPDEIMKNKVLPFKFEFKNEKNLDINALIKKFERYETKIYNDLKFTDNIDPINEIFRIMNEKNKIKINSGSFFYQIQIFGCNLELGMISYYCSLPKLCKRENFIIDRPEYRLCDSTSINTDLCYECVCLHCSRDIFYFIVEFLKESGMLAEQLKTVSVTFHPPGRATKAGKKYIYKYLQLLYDEKEESTYFWR